MRLLRPVLSGKTACLVFSDDSRFSFLLEDTYWNTALLKNEFSYEPEISSFLEKIKDLDYAFIDLGANWGYWSVLVSSPHFGNKKTLAVEASRGNFDMLQKNLQLNRGRFVAIRAAISDQSGVELKFSTGAHAGRHIIDPEEGYAESFEEVRSITIDDLLREHKMSTDETVIVKLDVEGHEIQALRGFSTLHEREALIIYEDHGKEHKHQVTQFAMNDLGLSIYYLSLKEEGRLECQKIHKIEELSDIKTNPRIGYNFFACRAESLFSTVLDSLLPPNRETPND